MKIQKKLMYARQHGFGLIELMVAMTLGLLVLGAAIGIFQSNQQTFKANEGVNRIQESARVAYEMIANDIRSAGGAACSNLATPDVEHINNDEEKAFFETPISGTSSDFTVVSGDDSSYPVSSSTTNSVIVDVNKVKATLNPDFALTDAVKSGDVVIICSANQFYIKKATNVSATTIEYSGATPVAMTLDPMAPPSSVMVARYRENHWFLKNGSLFVDRGGNEQEVIENVSALNITYLTRGATTYVAPPVNWANVISVRVNMTLNGKDAVEGNAIIRNFSSVISLRSRNS